MVETKIWHIIDIFKNMNKIIQSDVDIKTFFQDFPGISSIKGLATKPENLIYISQESTTEEERTGSQKFSSITHTHTM